MHGKSPFATSAFLVKIMIDDEKPITMLIWERFRKVFLYEASLPFANERWELDMKRNGVSLLQSALIAIAAWLVFYLAARDLLVAWKWTMGKLSYFQGHQALWGAALLISMAGMAYWIKSVILRLWRYCRQANFIPFLAVGGAWIIWHSGQVTPRCPVMSVLGGLIVFSAVASRLWRSASPAGYEEDKLQRSYFVDRLMTCLTRNDAKMRRFAILGGWGSGKTFVLQLLRKRLEESRDPKFGTATINPWKVQSIGEIHAMIARAFEEALGYRDYIQSPIMRWKWLKTVAELKFGEGPELGLDLKQLLEGGGSALHEDRLVQRINDILAAEDRTCVIMVDDMERAATDVIRQVFPMIDVLSRIKRCFFVFAIDPMRIASAFNEKQPNEEQTKGYLDKVFDVQIRLPQPRPEDFSRVFKDRIDSTLTPKLFAAWDDLESALPETPRQVIHFVNEAAMRESLFLSRYGPQEHDYTAFFKFLILNLELRGITERIGPELMMKFQKDCANASPPSADDEDDDGGDFGAIYAATWKAATAGLVVPAVRESKLQVLFYEVLNSELDLFWACNHHMRLLVLNHEERQRLHLVWEEQAGNKSILEMIRITFPGVGFTDLHKIAIQHIENERNRHQNIREKLRRTGSQKEACHALSEVTVSIGCFAAHLQFASLGGENLSLYPKDYFKFFIQELCRGDLKAARTDASDIVAKECEHCIQASDLLSTAEAFALALTTSEDIIHRYGWKEERDDLFPFADKLRAHLQLRLYRYLIEQICNGQIGVLSWLHEFEVESLAEVFGNLTAWNPFSDNLEALRELSVKLQSNPHIAAQMAKIAETFLIAVLDSLNVARERNRNYAKTKALVTDVTNDHPDYVSLIWSMALRCDDKLDELMRLFNKARNQTDGNSSLTREQFDRAFPAPEQCA